MANYLFVGNIRGVLSNFCGEHCLSADPQSNAVEMDNLGRPVASYCTREGFPSPICRQHTGPPMAKEMNMDTERVLIMTKGRILNFT